MLCLLIGLALRGLWLDWQPLWWDEGYSAYIATEPFARMVWLTAHDIHPPLYYGLLQGWIALAGTADSVHLRLFSVLAGFAALPLLAWFTQSLFPKQTRVIWLALLLLAINPMHIYYSHEIRMYALAMTLGLVSSTFAWRLLTTGASRQNIIGYAISAALCLYTLYFSVLLLAAHFLWAIWCKCCYARFRSFIYAQGIAFILYLPWLIYATPKLILYVTDKVSVEKDISLGPFLYIWRHLWAFINGHIPLGYQQTDDSWNALAYIGPLATILLLLFLIVRQYHSSQHCYRKVVKNPDPIHLLFALLIVPCLGGYIINYLWPFFPTGGERMLLFILPYFLVLLAIAIERWFVSRYAYTVWSVLIGLLVCASLAIITFYTTPRHVENDYRALIRQVIQQGRAEDTILALFPWQVGYWRAYSPQGSPDKNGPDKNGPDKNGPDKSGPQPLLVDDGIIEWNDALIQAIEQALAQGTLWFPEPRAFGSTLPAEIRAYLQPLTTNLEDRWYTPTTLLSAWHSLERGEAQALKIDFGPIHLKQFSVQPTTVASANQPLHVELWWETSGYVGPKLYGTLRLQDANGYTWASRDYLLLGNLDNSSKQDQELNRMGLTVPAGLAPGPYRLMFAIGQDEKLITPAGSQEPLIQLTEVQITQPIEPLSRFQLPIQRQLNPPISHKGLQLLGVSGTTPNSKLAGTEMALALFFRNQYPQQHIAEQHIYVSVLDIYGTGVGGWQGWTLPDYPIEQWPQNALVQVPVQFPLPATLEAGSYRLVAGLVEPESGEKTSFTLLDRLTVTQRSANFIATIPERRLEHTIQFGTHVRLRGYDYQHIVNDADTITLEITLHWMVMDTLLPDHHIFVHLNRANHVEDGKGQATLTIENKTIVQDDGPPMDGSTALPSGSWLPGEYLQTTHTLKLPPDLSLEERDISFYVGLYAPKTLIRLPATIEGQSIGDAALLQP